MDYSTELLTAELSFSADADIENKLAGIDQQIEKYTNHADRFDYTLAVASGLLSGVMDSFFVGAFSFEGAFNSGKESVDEFVLKVAKKQGYDGNDLTSAVKHLEEKFPIAADKATNDFGGGLYHHLRDFSHHPTQVGLFFSILTQFTGKVYGTNTHGEFIPIDLNEDGLQLIGRNVPEKITFGVINWFYHMVSDMAGSSGSIMKHKPGTGLPGPIGSLLKEVSALPVFKEVNDKDHKEASVWVSKLFNGTLLGKKNADGKVIEAVPFDLRTEIGIAEHVGKQALPVLINECVIRAFYFIRRLIMALKENDVRSFEQFKALDWGTILPWSNRTITRMLTISTATFSAADMTDAAVRAAIESAGNYVAFSIKFASRINYVGIGRVALAIKHDYDMESEEARLWHEKRLLVEQKSAQIVAQIDAYKEQLKALVSQYIAEDIELYLTSFNEMDEALETGDSDAFIHANVAIQSRFGREAQFETQEEFDELMDSDEAFVL